MAKLQAALRANELVSITTLAQERGAITRTEYLTLIIISINIPECYLAAMSLRLALCLCGLAWLAPVPARGEMIISEFVASNQTGLVDEEGDRPDWLELFNSGPGEVALEGWGLTDDPDQRA